MSTPPALRRLRARIDKIDDRMHDLIRARAGIVHQVRGVQGRQAIFIRPIWGATCWRGRRDAFPPAW